MSDGCFALTLPNGWTFSMSDEVRPFICNVAAWPTSDPKGQPASEQRWYEWESGAVENRCVSMGEVGLLLTEVMAAAPPLPRGEGGRKSGA